MDTVSIIMPVYRVEAWLRRALDSLVGQTYPHLEIFLVDDGSPDGSGAICDEYAQKDPRVKVLHQKNAGVSAARNAAFDRVTGDWIAFCDGDDWYEPDYVEKMLSAAQKEEADLVICNYQLAYDDRPPASFESLAGLVGKDTRYLVACGSLYSPTRLIKRDLLERSGVRYPLGCKQSEELPVLPVLTRYAHKVAILDAPLYNYYQRSNGTSASNANPDREVHVTKSLACLKAALGPGYEKEFEYHVIYQLIYGQLLHLCKQKASRRELKEKIRAYQAEYPEFRKNPYIGQLGRAKNIFLLLADKKCVTGLRLLAWIHRRIVH